MAKKRALFIPASIRSHLLPSFYLAELLSQEYDIVYGVSSEILGEICRTNGFRYFIFNGPKIGLGMEEQYVRERFGRPGFIRLLQTYITNRLYGLRKELYDRIVADWTPDVVVLDVFMSTDFFILNQYQSLTTWFFNPMPSIYNESLPPGGPAPTNARARGKTSGAYRSLARTAGSLRQFILDAVRRRQHAQFIRFSGIASRFKPVGTKFTTLFENVPELLLLPEEFELPFARKRDFQVYLGLCQRADRVDTELDDVFFSCWPAILDKREAGHKILYCSFGTFFEGADKRLFNFVTMLCAVIEQTPGIQLVCSVNKYVIEAMQNVGYDRDRIALFHKVPQTTVLANASAFITHGGMGSIKESIFYNVPMIVLPLDLFYDQSDNALRVEHHKLGVRGVFEFERSDSLRAKILDVLDNNLYKDALRGFNRNIKWKYSDETMKRLLSRSPDALFA